MPYPPKTRVAVRPLHRLLCVAIVSICLSGLERHANAAPLPGDPDDPALGPHELLPADRPSGEYWFDPDGPGGMDAFEGSYDAGEGGGWLLVLNYVHKRYTNPELSIRTDGLPVLGDGTLGADQSATEYWGHAAPALLAHFNVTELRFFGATSDHRRVIHFATQDERAIIYASNGVGSMLGVATSHTLLSGHSARLPAEVDHGWQDEGDLALTNFPFWTSCCNWGIRAPDAQSVPNRWEVDETYYSSTRGDREDTIHRVWIRTTSVCGDGAVDVDERCDDGNTESGDGCSVKCGVEHGFSCSEQPSRCTSECGDALVARDEECDDGNRADGDGCDGRCLRESNWECGGEPSECAIGARSLDGGATGQELGSSACAARAGAAPHGVEAFLLVLFTALRRRSR